MTKKDYERLARAFAQTRPNRWDHAEYDAWVSVREAVANELQNDNERFSYVQFCAATLR